MIAIGLPGGFGYTGTPGDRHDLPDGSQANDAADDSIDMTPDGRFVGFTSRATNLADGVPVGVTQLYLFDRQTSEIELISQSSNGDIGDGSTYSPAISNDGRYVAFWSFATNLVPNDENDKTDVFRRDRFTGETVRVTVGWNGDEPDGHSGVTRFSDWFMRGTKQVTVSGDGRYVAFASEATNLIQYDTNGKRDVFVWDDQTQQLERVSVSSTGGQANNGSSGTNNDGWVYDASIGMTPDGRYVAFDSLASNLVVDDPTSYADVYVHDRVAHQTFRVPVQGTSDPYGRLVCYPELSSDGRFVTFLTSINDLVPGQVGGVLNIFRYDRHMTALALVSMNQAGEGGNDWSSGWDGVPAPTAGGAHVVFSSFATNLTNDPIEGPVSHVYVRAMDPDCNSNGKPDSCDLEAGSSEDCNTDSVPDECQIGWNDCNTTGVVDVCETASGTAQDCNLNGLADECEPDCNTNDLPDTCEGYADCNTNHIADFCDLAGANSEDCNANSIPDECEPYYYDDCNTNGATDLCDPDCNTNDRADDCEIGPPNGSVHYATQPEDVLIPDSPVAVSEIQFAVFGAVQDVNVQIDIGSFRELRGCLLFGFWFA